MPEGPEVQAISEFLNKMMAGCKCSVTFEGFVDQTKIKSVASKGKLIIIDLDHPNGKILFHLGLDGYVLIHQNEKDVINLIKGHRSARGSKLFQVRKAFQLDVNYPNESSKKIEFYHGTGSKFKWNHKDCNEELNNLGKDLMKETELSIFQHFFDSNVSRNKNIESILNDQHIFAGMGKRWKNQLSEQFDLKTKLGEIEKSNLQKLIHQMKKIGEEMYQKQSEHLKLIQK